MRACNFRPGPLILFAPHGRRRGLPIGNLTSQFFANLYLDRFDHWVTEVLQAPYVRYVDDFALFHDDPAVLADWRSRIERYLEGRRLKLHPGKSAICKTAEDAQFLGLVLLPGGYRRLPQANVARFRNRLRGLRHRWRAGAVQRRDIEAKAGAWPGSPMPSTRTLGGYAPRSSAAAGSIRAKTESGSDLPAMQVTRVDQADRDPAALARSVLSSGGL